MLLKGTERMRREGVALEKAMSDLSMLYQRTRELDQRKTDFFANVSHELRTPLTLILAPVDALLRRTDLSEEARAELQVVRRNARGLLGHVNDLLDVQKLDARKLSVSYRAIDLAELLRGSISQFDTLAREREVRLSLVAPAALTAQVDDDKILRVFLNLLSNAFKFTEPGGAITIELRSVSDKAQGQIALFSVGDSGPGVAPEDRTRIFERFAQGTSSAQGRAGGTGLGLAIVRELLELHGGKIEVGTSPLGGALFEARLPLRAPEGALVAQDTRGSREGATGALRASKELAESLAPFASGQPSDASATDLPRVLLVEDNDDMRRLLAGLLRARYRVIEARDGEQGLYEAEREPPDLIISDVMMPKLTGDELVSRVRQNAALDRVPILLLTAKADEELRSRILRAGAQDYLLKPFESEELLARVHNLIAMRRAYSLLRSEVAAQQGDVEALSREVISQKRSLEGALEAAKLAREEAEQASRQKSDFLSLVSHELRTPLTSIRLQVERLNRGRTGVLNAHQSEAVGKIQRSYGRLFDMVESLLQFGRLELGRLQVGAAELDLVAITHEVIEELRPRAEEKGLALSLAEVSGAMPMVSDRELVRLIVANLCDNAIKYTASGEVQVSLIRHDDGELSIRVRDTGMGIELREQQRVFLPFEQLEPVRHKQGSGVGLGLALVKRVADALNAQVALESQQGVGSTFSVTFHARGA
jgi:signal transduction histidine kinase